jgi:hypothetical protein
MYRKGLIWLIFLGNLGVAAELSFDFSTTKAGELPGGYVSLLAGEGRPGRWEVVQAQVAPALAPLNPQAPRTSVKSVLTQSDHDPTDERFPILAYSEEEFADFTVTARMRIIGGQTEQMAGIAFRLQDAENFYVARLSALGQNLRFYKVVTGMRGRLIGPSLPIKTNVWYDLTIRCEGNEIVCLLDGNLVMPPLQDMSFSRGKLGFWTKSDSICQFGGASVTYTPIVPLSKQVVADALEKYPRVVDLRLYTLGEEGAAASVVASKHPEDLGTLGGKAEVGAIRHGNMYFGKDKKKATVVLPVRDRNGDPVAAARIVLDSFAGQTENNAIVRAKPIVQLMEEEIATSREAFR